MHGPVRERGGGGEACGGQGEQGAPTRPARRYHRGGGLARHPPVAGQARCRSSPSATTFEDPRLAMFAGLGLPKPEPEPACEAGEPLVGQRVWGRGRPASSIARRLALRLPPRQRSRPSRCGRIRPRRVSVDVGLSLSRILHTHRGPLHTSTDSRFCAYRLPCIGIALLPLSYRKMNHFCYTKCT